MDLESLKYPIGRFVPRPHLAAADREAMIADIAGVPADLATLVTPLDGSQLDTPYRPDGWTVRQLIHHLPDSHLHAYVRFKLALTEDQPTIKPYDEAAWAMLPDGRGDDTASSLQLLAALHRRWGTVLRSMAPDQWQRTFRHPERGTMTLDTTLQLYHWHGRHHLAHIASLAQRSGW